MNDTLRDFFDQFCIVYINDILIYSKTRAEHHEQVRKVLQKLNKASLYTKPEKGEFSVEKTTFFSFIISANGIKMDPAKVEAVLIWETSNSVKDDQCFLGFAKFYWRFIHKYSYRYQPVFNLLQKYQNQEPKTTKTKKKKKVAPFIWFPVCEKMFNQLKTSFTSAHILCQFDPDLETILEYNASDYIVLGVLSQKHLYHDPNTIEKTWFTLHPVAFISEKISPA